MAEPVERYGGAPWVDVVLELALVALGSVLVALLLLRSALLHTVPGSPAIVRRGLLASIFAILMVRAARNRQAEDGHSGTRPGEWLRGLRAPGLILAAGFLYVLLLVPLSATGLGADGLPFLNQTRALALERRLDVEPGVEPGAAILWSPFFLVAHVLVHVGIALGIPLSADGTGPPYQNALRLGSITYAFLAVVLVHRAACRWFEPRLVAVCVTAGWLGSSLFHYSVAEPAMAHAPAAAVTSLFVLLWLRLREEPTNARRWLGLAACGGVLVSIQRYDAYFFVLPALTALRLALQKPEGSAKVHRTALVAGSIVAFGIAVLPLVLVALSTSDRSLIVPSLGDALRYWSRPHLGEVLFSSNGGLFAWTPIAYCGAMGLLALLSKDWRTGGALLVTFVAGVYLMSSNIVWWGGWSFGARRLTEAFPLVALGLCALAELLMRRPAVLGLVSLVALVGWNHSLSAQLSRGAIAQGTSVRFVDAAQRALQSLYSDFGHPSSFPASWLFAWRHDVTPDRFDELYGRAPTAEVEVSIGTPEDGAVVGRGWSPRQSGADGRPFRWSEGLVSSLLVTLPSPAPYRLHFEGVACRHPGGRAQTFAIEVNGHAAGEVSLAQGSVAQEIGVPASAWREGLNEITLRYAWSLPRTEAETVGEREGSAWRLQVFALRQESPAKTP